MGKKLDVDVLGHKIGKNSFKRCWVNYNFGNGYGKAMEGVSVRSVRPSMGYIFNNYGNLSVRAFVREFKNNNWDKIACFYAGVTAFCLSEDVVDFDVSLKKDVSLSSCVLNLSFPTAFEADLKEIWRKCRQERKHFRSFLKVCRTIEKVKVDINSALEVFELQGYEAIFGILCQIFWYFNGVGQHNCCVIPNILPNFAVRIDNFVSGTTFPVVVSPFTTDFRWVWRNGGCFVECCIGGVWFVFDCISVGQYGMWNESTSARKNFWSVGGDVVPYFVCWNWGEVLEAVGHFRSDVIIRDFRTNFMNNYWFRFGLGGMLTVNWRDAHVCGKYSTVSATNNVKLHGVKKEGRNTVVDINLNGDYLGNSTKEVVYTQEEVDDWLEMGAILQDTMPKSTL